MRKADVILMMDDKERERDREREQRERENRERERERTERERTGFQHELMIIDMMIYIYLLSHKTGPKKVVSVFYLQQLYFDVT